MSVAIITGSCGLVGSESSIFFSEKGFDIVGIDNNSRKFFFGKDKVDDTKLDPNLNLQKNEIVEKEFEKTDMIYNSNQEDQNLQIKLGGQISGDIKLSDKIQPIKKDTKTSNDNVSMQEAMKKEEK